MQTVLITGEMGVGKSQAINWLKQRFFSVFQADNQANSFLKSSSVCYPQLKKLFFEQNLYLSNGEFDKKSLAQVIFQDLKKRRAMEAIIHPLVRESFKQFVEKHRKKGGKIVFYEAPLLSRSILKACDYTVLITCPRFIRKKRLLLKGWTEAEVEERLSSQIDDFKIEDQVDFIVDNRGEIKDLEAQLNQVLLTLGKEELC